MNVANPYFQISSTNGAPAGWQNVDAAQCAPEPIPNGFRKRNVFVARLLGGLQGRAQMAVYLVHTIAWPLTQVPKREVGQSKSHFANQCD